MSSCRGSVAEHWWLKSEVSWAWLPATGGAFSLSSIIASYSIFISSMRQDALRRWTCFFANFVYNRKYTICTCSRIHCFHNSQLPMLRLREKRFRMLLPFSKLTEFKTVGRRRLSTYSPPPCTLTYTMHELWHTEILYACRDSACLSVCSKVVTVHLYAETVVIWDWLFGV